MVKRLVTLILSSPMSCPGFLYMMLLFPRDLDSNNLVTVPEGLFGGLRKLEHL